MHIASSQKYKHRYLIQLFVLIITLYYCLLHISRSPKNGHAVVIDKDTSLKDTGSKRLKGNPFEQHNFKLKVDFSSEEAGAKIIAQSKTLLHVRSIQNNDRNSYLLAPCQNTDWFILSFSESISVKQIAFISYEYYASTYKIIRISAAPLYPSEKWHILAEVERERGQSEVFDISSVCDRDDNVGCWAKYLKVELLEFHDYEDNYYCTLTSMKVYGSTAVDVLESEITNDNYSLHGNERIFDASNVKAEREDRFLAPVRHTRILNAPPDISTKRSDLAVVDHKRTYIHPLILNHTSMGHMNPTVRRTILRFMIQLASRSDKCGINRHLYVPLMRFMRRKQCRIPCFMSIVKDREHLINNIPGSNRYCWSMMFNVKLPIHHTWFEGVVYMMIKQGMLNSTINIIANGVKNPPLLVCIRRCGFLGGFTCYSHFVYTTFATFTSRRKSKGFLPNRNPDLPLRSFYFFHSECISHKVVPVSIKGMSYMLIDGRYVKGLRFIVSHNYISTLTLSTNTCTLTMKGSITEDMKIAHSLADLAFKSYVNIAGTHSAKVTKSWDILKLLVQSINKMMEPYRFDNRRAIVRNRSKLPAFAIVESSKEDCLPDISKAKTRSYEEHNNQFKRSQGHKHVLLQISERVKALEILTNHLNQKVYQVNDALKSYVDYMNHLKILQRITFPMHHISKWGNRIQDEVDLILRACAIERLHVIFLYSVPSNCISNENCIEGRVSSRFSLCTFFLKSGKEGFERTIRHNSCPINRLRPKHKRGYCSTVRPLSPLTVCTKALRRYKLLECCRKYGCECGKTNITGSTVHLWMPHFSKNANSSSGNGMMGHISYWTDVCLRYILCPSYVALCALLRVVFNIYTISLCLLFMQTFWLYRDRTNRLMLREMYAIVNLSQETKTNSTEQVI